MILAPIKMSAKSNFIKTPPSMKKKTQRRWEACSLCGYSVEVEYFHWLLTLRILIIKGASAN